MLKTIQAGIRVKSYPFFYKDFMSDEIPIEVHYAKFLMSYGLKLRDIASILSLIENENLGFGTAILKVIDEQKNDDKKVCF